MPRYGGSQHAPPYPLTKAYPFRPDAGRDHKENPAWSGKIDQRPFSDRIGYTMATHIVVVARMGKRAVKDIAIRLGMVGLRCCRRLARWRYGAIARRAPFSSARRTILNSG